MDGIPIVLFIIFTARIAHGASCNTKFSDAYFMRFFGFKASSETTKNKASDAFTVGWCATTKASPNLEVDFKNPYGISGIHISGPTNRDGDPYPTSVLVKYVPNGGDVNTFVHFPLQEGKLVINMTTSGTVQTIFGQGIAVRKLQFTIQSFHGDACLKIDLIGCTIHDLCTYGCQNNGLCVMQDTCQCAQGYVGNNCEKYACEPVDLGLADGTIGADHIQVSSEDPVYNKAELGNSVSKKGWCPSLTDHYPWVQITLDKPKTLSVFSFMWSQLGGQNIMTEFELQYIAPIDSSKQFRTFATNIPSLNSTHIFTVTTEPVVTTDTFRIIATNWDNRACFKVEIKGCDPTVLCSSGWCQNGGTCMGENVCLCPSGFVGSRCEIATNQITLTNMTFVKIENHEIVTSAGSLQFTVTGNVKLDVVDNKPVVTINGTDSCIKLNNTAGVPTCITNVNLCPNGFTFTIDVKFDHLLDNTYIVSSGGHLPGYSGITLYYTNKNLHYIVSTSTQLWTLVVPYKPVLHLWQHFEITWNKHLGVELLIDGHSLGSNSRPAGQPTTTLAADLSIGCSLTFLNVYTDIQVTNFNMWPLDRTELVNAGIKEPPATSSSSKQSTAPTVAETTPIPALTTESTARPTTVSTVTSVTRTSTSLTSLTSSTYFQRYTTMPSASTSVQYLKLEDAISAKCTSYGWNISMDLSILWFLYPGITVGDIYLSSAKCNGTILNDKLWFQQSFETCATREEVVDGAKVYRNVLFYASFDNLDPTIVRQHFWTYNVACYVSNGEATSSHLRHEVESHSTNITAHRDISMSFFKDRNFLHQVSGNPLRVTVGDNVYVKVSTSIPDWSTKMRLHTCYTRSSDDTFAEHILIRDGCEVDSRTHIISQSTHSTKFVFRDFEYLTFNEGLDIFCNATFCDTSDYSSACTQACRQSPPIVG